MGRRAVKSQQPIDLGLAPVAATSDLALGHALRTGPSDRLDKTTARGSDRSIRLHRYAFKFRRFHIPMIANTIS
jgi:hypothetical protein